ncbi:hypothetical protein BZG36_03237 [Bifiguratus adelaidae]|uniref:Uncharacterized protein n=1 Tax=Bifiguratus adelaidae TaxID=1938954 RepID=A0A261Y071_9FUNG|nr:hypothetical protein BZG36_03237 [Bifiguratus adelaidae]
MSSNFTDFSPYQPAPDENRQKKHASSSSSKKKGVLGSIPSLSSGSNGKASSGKYQPIGGSGAGQDQYQHQQNFSSYQSGGYSGGSDFVGGGGQSSWDVEQGFGNASESSGMAATRVNKYETSLPIRVDVEAALTYVLGAVTGVFFLIAEQKNDYVRFHAWQSSLLFLVLMIVEFIIMFISNFLAWTGIFVGIALALYLAWHAYVDGAALERYMVPYIGPIASEWTDSE